jgi:uncharacterized protein
MASPVIHFEVIGRDGDALRSFYGELFGWEIQKMEGDFDYGVIQRGDGGIGGGIGASDEGSGHVTFYVGVDDVQAALDKAGELGGETVMGPTEVPGGPTIGLFTDPEGHTIGVVKNP